MDTGNVLAEMSLNLLVTIAAYLLVPTILVLTGKVFKAKTLKRIIVINCIVVWLAFRIIQIEMGIEPGSGAAAILWGSVGYWLLKKNCLKEEKTEILPQQEKTTQIPAVQVCLSNEGEVPYFKGSGTLSSDVALQENAEKQNKNTSITPPTVKIQQKYEPTSVVKKLAKYCSNCGRPIDSITKKCTGCGKQYFKGISWRTVTTILLVLFLCVSIAGNIFLVLGNNERQKRMEELRQSVEQLETDKQNLEEAKETIEQLKSDKQILAKENYALKVELESKKEKIEFFDEYVVFVKNNTNIYHRYDCDRFINDYIFWLEDGEFWAYNVDYAIYIGNNPCSSCCK